MSLMELASKDLNIINTHKNNPTHKIMIWLHGLGADNQDFEPLVEALDVPKEIGLTFVMPNAPVRSITLYGGMEARGWFDIIDLSGRDLDKDGIKKTSEQIHALIEKCIEQGIASKDILLGGFSQGGAIALYAGLTFTKPLAGIMALSTFMPLRNEIKIQQKKDLPIFLAHGKQDDVLAFHLGESSAEWLSEQGFKRQWHSYDNCAHHLCEQEVVDITNWLKNNLASKVKTQ